MSARQENAGQEDAGQENVSQKNASLENAGQEYKAAASRHAPCYRENPEHKGIVVFIHGFMGSPRHFDRFAEQVYQQGFSTYALLLPAHDCSAKTFASGTAEMWQEYVDAEIARVSGSYERIILAGHSMGGLLALSAALRSPDKINGVVVIESPLKLAVFSAKANISRARFIFSRKSNPIKAEGLAVLSVRRTPDLLWHVIRPFSELKKLMRDTTRALPGVRAPVTAVYSLSDELVSIASLDILRKGVSEAGFKQVVLSNSTHCFYPGNERYEVEQALIGALQPQAESNL